jgi:hypothetical protein
MPVNVGGYEITKEMIIDGSSSDYAAPSADYLRDRYPGLPNGNYWINVGSLGPQLVYCILDAAVGGGGWMGITSTICPQINNVSTSSSWETNSSNRLYSNNSSILNVSVVETGCGGTSFYELESPSVYGMSYTKTMLLMERISTIGQCSQVTGGSDQGWFVGPEFDGIYNSQGMCTWGDGIFANPCCGAQNMTGLKPYWVLFGSGVNPNLNYSVQCAGGSGTHYHMWFIK